MAAEALEQSMLESKDKEQLLAIAQALGIKTTARAAKATLIDKILETTSAVGDGRGAGGSPPATNGRAPRAAKESPAVVAPADPPVTDSSPALAAGGPSDAGSETPSVANAAEPEVILGPDGEPLADWEIELIKSGEVAVTELAVSPAASSNNGTSAPAKNGDGQDGEKQDVTRQAARSCGVCDRDGTEEQRNRHARQQRDVIGLVLRADQAGQHGLDRQRRHWAGGHQPIE